MLKIVEIVYIIRVEISGLYLFSEVVANLDYDFFYNKNKNK